MRALLAIAALLALSAGTAPGCSPTQTPPPAPEPTTMPPMPDHDAGSSAASCKTACANLDGKLHCSDMWPGGTCSSGCANLNAGMPGGSSLLKCFSKAATCDDARACKLE